MIIAAANERSVAVLLAAEALATQAEILSRHKVQSGCRWLATVL